MSYPSKKRVTATARLAAAALAAALTLSLAACGAHPAAGSAPSTESDLSVNNTESGGASSAASASADADTLRALPGGRTDGTSVKAGINTGDAYYELPNNNAFGHALLLKTDYATGTQACICQKPACAHTDASCNAYVETMPRQNMCIVNNKICIVFGGFPTEQRVPEDEQYKTSTVDVISLDGLTKQRISSFPKDLFVSFFYCDDKALYGQYQKMEKNSSNDNYSVCESGMLRFDVETGEYTTVPFVFEDESMVGTYENEIVTSHLTSDQDLNALMENGNHEAYEAARQSAGMQYDKVNPVTGERTMLVCIPVLTNLMATAYQGRLWYEKTTDTLPGQLLTTLGLFANDLATGEESMVMDFSDGRTFDGWLSPDFLPPNAPQTPLLLAYRSAMPNADHVAYLQEDTGEVRETSLKTKQNQTPPLLAQANDGRWLIAIDRVGEGAQERYCYALISPEDFWAGNANYTEVTPYDMPT